MNCERSADQASFYYMSLPKPKGQDHIFKAVPVDSQAILTFQGWRGKSKSQAMKGRAALGLVQVGPRQDARSVQRAQPDQ